MNITVNGKVEKIDIKAITLSGYLQLKKINPSSVAVEINMDIVKRDEFGSTPIKDGDVIEILHFVGGGSNE